MANRDFVKLSKKELLEHFENERQEWLALGMSEAVIFRVHFGDLDSDGKLIRPKDGSYGGDYLLWLAERKHTRPDHKYAPGTPVAIDTVDPDGAWISSGRGGIDDAEFNVDLEAALSTLTELQRFCFVEVCINDRTYRSVAAERGKSVGTVSDAVRAAKEKMKNFFG